MSNNKIINLNEYKEKLIKKQEEEFYEEMLVELFDFVFEFIIHSSDAILPRESHITVFSNKDNDDIKIFLACYDKENNLLSIDIDYFYNNIYSKLILNTCPLSNKLLIEVMSRYENSLIKNNPL